MIRRRLAMTAVAFFVATATSATRASANPLPRVLLVRPAHMERASSEAATRLQAELAAAGFAVIVTEAEPGGDPRSAVAGADSTPVIAVVTIVTAAEGAVPEVWIATRVHPRSAPHRLTIGRASGSDTPASLAIRTVEELRASLLEVADDPRQPSLTPTPPVERVEADDGSPRSRADRRRALLEGSNVEVGLMVIYGLGDTTGRLAPTFRYAYGAPFGLAGRLTVMGPSASDQLGLMEVAWGFDRSWAFLAPVVSAGGGAIHTHIDDTVTPSHPMLRTETWAGLLSASAGLAGRPTQRVSVLLDAHALLALPARGAILGGEPAHGRPAPAVTVSIGVVAGF
jgi:hypothetical protein